jgi:hypothetical protein
MRFLGPDCALDDFISAGNARLNIVVSPFLNPLAQWMFEEIGMPYVSLHDVYDASEIKGLYAEIAGRLNLTAAFESETALADQCQRVAEMQDTAFNRLNGLNFVLAQIGAVQPLPLLSYLSRLGIHPLLAHMDEFYPSDRAWRKKLLEQGENPIICLLLNDRADRDLICGLRPDCVLGIWGGNDRDASCVPFLMDLYGQIGYERSAALLERVMKALPQKDEGSANGTA